MSTAARIGVIGAGAWGTALAQMLAADGAPVSLWAREEEVASAINATRRNAVYLPDAELSSSIVASSELASFAELRHAADRHPCPASGSGHGRGAFRLCAAMRCCAPRGSRRGAAA